MKKKLAIITTHPIQYYAPLFKMMSLGSPGFAIKVFYTAGSLQKHAIDPDFGFAFKWDIPLLEGYEYTFVNNISDKPTTRHFGGIVNPTLIKEIEEWKADAVLVFGWSFKSHLKAIRHFHGKIPVLFKGDSNLLDEAKGFTIKKFLRRKFLHWVYHYIDFALYSGEANKQYFLVHGIKENQLTFSPHSVDNERFSGNDNQYEQQAAEWRAALNIKENECVFLFSGKLTKKKNPEILIKAFIALNKKDTVLVIIGNGELGDQLKEKYKQYAKIFFISFQNQSRMPVVYRLANVFVLPSQGPGETWGLAVNEAMACARAIIVSDKCGCAQDLVQTGKNGYVFQSNNIESLKRCMRLALHNSKEFGCHSYRIIQAWTYPTTIDGLNNLFQKAGHAKS